MDLDRRINITTHPLPMIMIKCGILELIRMAKVKATSKTDITQIK